MTCWEAPKFSFSTQNPAGEWRSFHTRAIDSPKVTDIDAADETKNSMEAAKDDICGR